MVFRFSVTNLSLDNIAGGLQLDLDMLGYIQISCLLNSVIYYITYYIWVFLQWY